MARQLRTFVQDDALSAQSGEAGHLRLQAGHRSGDRHMDGAVIIPDRSLGFGGGKRAFQRLVAHPQARNL